MATTLLQWNCRGFRANFNELQLLTQEYNPRAICLQETLLQDTDSIDFRGYNLLNTYSGNGPHGGSSILIRQGVLHSPVSLNTNLQAVAVRLTLHVAVTLCSLYIPPSQNVQQTDLDSLVEQLPKPFIIMGDLNGHNPLWGSHDVNNKGKNIEKLLSDHQLCIFNDGANTYLHPATGTYTAIDLSITNPELIQDYKWFVHDDLCGSDHFPTVLESITPCPTNLVPRWNFNKADWDRFAGLCKEKITADTFQHDTDPIESFSNLLINIASDCIPKTSTIPRIKKPWFTENCKDSIKKRKKAEKYFKLHPSPANLNIYKQIQAKARRTIKNEKRQSWRNFISKITSRTPMSKVWNMVQRIKGKGSNSTIKHLNCDDDVLTSKTDIANAFAKSMSKVSSADNYDPNFKKFKSKQEKHQINFDSDNGEDYNELFSLDELVTSLNKAKDTAVGPDDIHYQLLKHLPESCLLVLRDIFNNIWLTGNFPPSWHDAIVVPIPKPGKDHTDPINYRPISLTSCVCKTFERMVNNRLTWFLETNNLLTNIQCGFRKNRSTIDHLVRLESFIRDGFINNQHVVSVFFDLEKAYVTTWKYGILNDLHSMGFRGRMPQFIDSFLQSRHFQVRVGSTLSDSVDQEMGVPQGAILSVTLFSIKINSLAKVLNNHIDGSLFVDDFSISCRGSNMATVERQLQMCLNKISKWALENGFRFSKSKTNAMHFCNKRKLHNDPELFLDKTPLKVVKEAKFLGLLFDNKLSFIPHIKQLKTKCLKALNLLKSVSGTKWGGDQKTLLTLYRALVRSKLDYGSVIYGSARKSYLKQLQTIHHQGLRLALGAFRTSPISSLYVEADETSLSERQIKLSLQYITKLKSNPSNPAYNCVFHPEYTALYERKPSAIPPLGIRIQEHIVPADINLDNIKTSKLINFPPWQMAKPTVNLELTKYPKSTTNQLVYQQHFAELKAQYPEHVSIYTDGSKDGVSVTAAAIVNNKTLTCRLPDNSSIFSAEAKAIQIALDAINDSKAGRYILYSDSLSCLQAIKSYCDNPFITEILQLHDHLATSQYEVVFCWLPGHVGIKGNNLADAAAKSAHDSSITTMQIPYSDTKQNINIYIKSLRQSKWDMEVHNKLHTFQPIIGFTPLSGVYCRQDETVLRRCRIGHTFYTHSYILKGEDRPRCVGCDEDLTVRHILLDCVDFATQRAGFYSSPNLKHLFTQVPGHLILSFLKEIGLYHKF